MAIPFLDIFKKATARFRSTSEPVTAPANVRALPIEKPTSERLSKTVMPNTTRPSVPDTFETAGDASPNIKMPAPRPTQLPPSVALALQPKVERAISLQLGDIVEKLPAGYIKPVESFDSTQLILLKASEIEKGMATGKPVVSLATVYAQLPDIFLRNVPADDTTQVALPFNKVLDQFQKVQVRSDQEEEYDVPQVDTPFLQVTLEDTERFGTPLKTIQTSAHPPVRVEAASARAFSIAEPEAAVRETIASSAPKGIPLNISTSPTVVPPSRPSSPEPASPTRIPFHLPPNGTGGSVTERVPASSEPSVPTSAPKSGSPARIPFKISPPSADLKPKLSLVPGVANHEEKKSEQTSATSSEASVGGDQISLCLRAVLQNMPAFQLNGSPDTVAADVRIHLPLALVESQLVTGRIAIPTKTLRSALPENHRELVVVDEAESPVLLPLQEVLKNLPSNVLKMREDQEEVDAAATFVTPFSIKAAEDAKRLAATISPSGDKSDPVSPKPVAGPDSTVVERKTAVIASESKPTAAQAGEKAAEKSESSTKMELKPELKSDPAPALSPPAVPPKPEEKKVAPTVEVKLEANTNAKEIVARVSALPGVAGSSITFADGLSLADNLPEDVRVGGLCAMAPSLLQKIDRHTVDTKLGPLTSMTLRCRESQMSFFMKGSVCLTVLHAGGDLASDTHNKLADMANELSRTYSQPETAHVDH